MVSISSLIVAVRTTGAAALVRLGAAFTALSAQARALGTRIAAAWRSVTAAMGRVALAAAATLSRISAGVRSLGGAIRTGLTSAWAPVAGMFGRVGLAGAVALNRISTAVRNAARSALRLPVLGAALRGIAVAARAAGRAAVAAFRGVSIAARATGRAIGRGLLAVLRRVVSVVRSLLSSLGSALATFGRIALTIGPLLVPLIPPLASLAGLLPLIAPAAFVAAAGVGALAVGIRGVGDAISAGLSGDMDEYRKALKGLAPAAQEFTKAVVASAPAWRQLSKAVQQNLFANLGKDFVAFSQALAPFLSKWLPQLAKNFNAFGRIILDSFAQVAKDGRLETMFKHIDATIGNLLNTVLNLGAAFFNLAEGAAGPLETISARIREWSEDFSRWMQRMREEGRISEWVDKAVETLGKLRDIGREIGRVFTAIFKGAETESKEFLDNVRDTFRRLADWLHSEGGQQFISGIAAIGVAIANVGAGIAKLKEWWDRFSAWVDEAHGNTKKAMAGIGAAIAPLYGIGLAAFAWISGARAAIQGLAATVRSAMSGIQGAINAVTGRTIFVDIITRRFDSPQGYGRGLGKSGSSGGGASARRSSGSIPERAAGGPVQAGRPYIVGEKRAELFVPSQSGHIYPNVASVMPNEAWQRAGGSGGGTQRVEVALYVYPRPGAHRDVLSATIEGLAYEARTRGGGDINVVLAGT